MPCRKSAPKPKHQRRSTGGSSTAQIVSSLPEPEDSAPENRANAVQTVLPKQSQKLKPKQQKPVTKATKPKQTVATRVPSAPVAANNGTASITTTEKIQRARGVLYGLSTLQRQGNVRVNVLADHTTVRSNFRLGPLQLRVEKAFGRGAKREVKSATATTTEMAGRITLRIVNGAATLHSIKVQQPRQVQVVSADNHDRTREFVWRKSAHLADVVSEQLTEAARSMLEPPPQEMVDNQKQQQEQQQHPLEAEVTKTTQVEIVKNEELEEGAIVKTVP